MLRLCLFAWIEAFMERTCTDQNAFAMKYKIIQNEQEDHQECLECGASLAGGRRDRKFCSDKCKNDYHNKASRASRLAQLKVISILNQNHQILMRLARLGMNAADLDDIIKLGFNPGVFTGHRKLRGHDQYYCFEFRYFQTPSRIYSLERTPWL